MQLDIILRTFDEDSVHPRCFNKPKRDIVWRSVSSLMTAIKHIPTVREQFGYDVTLTIIDDHSSAETVTFLRNAVSFMGDTATVTTLEGTGNNASMLASLTMGKASTSELLYIVEDDYLHQPDALKVALETWSMLYQKNKRPLMGMSLVDCASNYALESWDGHEAHILGGVDRPWRTIHHTGVCFLLERGVLQKHWQPFEDVAKYWPYFEERITFNRLWNTEVGMFCPLVPLTYHLWEDHPYYPVKDLWEANKQLELVA